MVDQCREVRGHGLQDDVVGAGVEVFAASDWRGGDTAERHHLTTVLCDGFRSHSG